MTANPQTHAVYEGGFSDPVGASQTVFRALMDAMARPGSVQALPDVTVPPAPLSASASALIATLADADTPVWLDAALTKSSAVRDWIVFHTGAPVVSHASDAAFALVAAPQKPVGAERLLARHPGVSRPLDDGDPAGVDAFERKCR
jgi:alpha-D-ribose 1-methylphosphonate 5-triphosphate synthase subunit PhnH